MQYHWISSFSTHLNLLAQTIPPPASPTKADILEKQVIFLSDANKTLVANFNLFSEIYNKLFLALIAILGIAATLATFLYWKTLKEAKQEAQNSIRREVNKAVSQYVQNEVDILRRLVERESSVFQVEIDYILSKGADKTTPEYKMLRDRGFHLSSIRYGVNRKPVSSITKCHYY